MGKTGSGSGSVKPSAKVLKDIAEREKLLKEHQEALDKLYATDAAKEAIAFKKELTDLMERYSYSENDLLSLFLDSEQVSKAKDSGRRTYPKRALKTYVNPHTGEKIQTRGHNHNTLKAWKKEYGAAEVEKWLTHVDNKF